MFDRRPLSFHRLPGDFTSVVDAGCCMRPRYCSRDSFCTTLLRFFPPLALGTSATTAKMAIVRNIMRSLILPPVNASARGWALRLQPGTFGGYVDRAL